MEKNEGGQKMDTIVFFHFQKINNSGSTNHIPLYDS